MSITILSFFKETKIWNCSYRVRHLRTVLKSFGVVTVVFVVLGSSLILLNPFQTNFSVHQEALYGKTKNLLKTGFVTKTKYLKIVRHVTVVNGVQGRMGLFITLPTPNFKTGSNDVYFKGSCLMSFE